MKRIILTTIVIMLTLSAFSQLRMGIAGGTEVAWLKSESDKVTNDGAVMGFQFGLLADYFFQERYSFATGISIHNTGGKLNYADSLSLHTTDEVMGFPADAKVRYRLQYLEVPMALHFESNQIGYFVYQAQFGITNHIRIGANADIPEYNNKKIVCKDEIGLYTMSYNVGGGVDYYVSKNTAITCSLIFSSSFVNLTPKHKSNTKLNTIALRLGVIF